MVLDLVENCAGRTIEFVLTCGSDTEVKRWLNTLTPSVETMGGETLYESWDCPQVTALFAYTPVQPDELALQVGECNILHVLVSFDYILFYSVFCFMFNFVLCWNVQYSRCFYIISVFLFRFAFRGRNKCLKKVRRMVLWNEAFGRKARMVPGKLHPRNWIRACQSEKSSSKASIFGFECQTHHESKGEKLKVCFFISVLFLQYNFLLQRTLWACRSKCYWIF